MCIRFQNAVAYQIFLTALLTVSCTEGEEKQEGIKESSKKEEVKMSMEIKTPVFEHGKDIPKKYTCKGEDVSPPLEWEGKAEGTESFVLIVDDPDAPVGVFDHWLVYNIPGESDSLPEGVSSEGKLPAGVKECTNSFGKKEYGGPCPPSGEHRYFFRIYALDTKLDLKEGAKRGDLEDAMEGHVLEKGEIMGVFAK